MVPNIFDDGHGIFVEIEMVDLRCSVGANQRQASERREGYSGIHNYLMVASNANDDDHSCIVNRRARRFPDGGREYARDICHTYYVTGSARLSKLCFPPKPCCSSREQPKEFVLHDLEPSPSLTFL